MYQYSHTTQKSASYTKTIYYVKNAFSQWLMFIHHALREEYSEMLLTTPYRKWLYNLSKWWERGCPALGILVVPMPLQWNLLCYSSSNRVLVLELGNCWSQLVACRLRRMLGCNSFNGFSCIKCHCFSLCKQKHDSRGMSWHIMKQQTHFLLYSVSPAYHVSLVCLLL